MEAVSVNLSTHRILKTDYSSGGRFHDLVEILFLSCCSELELLIGTPENPNCKIILEHLANIEIHMQSEHAITVRTLINRFRREDDIGKIDFENHKTLASPVNKWDIPMLLHDIDVAPFSFGLKLALPLRLGGTVIGLMNLFASL